MIQLVEPGLQPGNFPVDKSRPDEKDPGLLAGDQMMIILGPRRDNPHVSQLDTDARGPVIFLDDRELDHQGIAGLTGFVGHQPSDILAGLVRQKIPQGIKNHRGALILGQESLDGLQDMRMMSEHSAGAGFQETVSELDILWVRRRSILGSPMNRNQQKIALRTSRLDFFQNGRRIQPRSATRFTGIREKRDVRFAVLFGIAIAIQPASHPEPADLNTVLFDDDRLPGIFGRAPGSGKENSLFAQMFKSFTKARIALVKDVIVGEGDDLNSAKLQRLQESDGRIELKRP